MLGCAAAALLLGPGSGRAADRPVVFINLDRCFTEFYKTKLADTQLKEQADEFNDDRKKMVDDYNKLQDDFNALRDEAQNTALSDDVRSQKRNAGEDKLVEVREYEGKIRRFDETHRKQLDDQSRRMRKRIVDEIRVAVQNYSKVQGFEAVIDSSGQSLNGVETVVYSDSKIDITDVILEMLNKGKQEEGAADESASTPTNKPAVKKPAKK